MDVSSKIFLKGTRFKKNVEIRQGLETCSTFHVCFTLTKTAIRKCNIIVILSRDSISSKEILSKLKITPLKDLIER